MCDTVLLNNDQNETVHVGYAKNAYRDRSTLCGPHIFETVDRVRLLVDTLDAHLGVSPHVERPLANIWVFALRSVHFQPSIPDWTGRLSTVFDSHLLSSEKFESALLFTQSNDIIALIGECVSF